MFTIFSYLNSFKIKENEHAVLLKVINKYKNTAEGAWIKNLNIDKLSFYWCDDMTEENNVLGAWNFLFYNRIYLKSFDYSLLTGNKFMDESILESHFSLIIPVLFHEIYHRYQCQKLTLLLYIILAIPYIREFTIEPPAYKISDNAYTWIQKLSNEHFNETRNMLHIKFYGNNFNCDKMEFISNYDKAFCNAQYIIYKQLRKSGKIQLTPILTRPPDFYE